jgi:predicted DNA-binding transcriptional regulator YafY
MPQRKSNDTALRLLYLVEILKGTSRNQPLTRKDICSKLFDAGFDISDEQVGNDIEGLLEHKQHFLPLNGIKSNTRKKPFTYWYEHGVQDIVQVSPELAFALKLTQRYFVNLIPAREIESLQLLLESAEQIISRQSNVRYQRLLDRIEVHPRGLQLIPPEVDKAQLQTILEALANNRQLSFDYQPKGKKMHRVDVCDPLGLVDRSGILTLVVRNRDALNERNYNVNRISNLKVESYLAYPKDFRLKKFIADGHMNVQFEPRTVQLHLRLNRRECADMLESKLSADQTVVISNDEFFEIKATVPHNIELIWWLLERRKYVEVLAPDCVKERIEKERG